jgi:hypothetical protein
MDSLGRAPSQRFYGELDVHEEDPSPDLRPQSLVMAGLASVLFCLRAVGECALREIDTRV